MNQNNNNLQKTLDGPIGVLRNNINSYDPVLSCVQPLIEQKSLQVSMESNRESLERRLQLRRTLPELVSQGIYPKLNTPLAFAEQCRQLEQAKARDQLQKKLKHRPNRQCLVQHHILEDTHPFVDRSLQDKQRLLKKSKLQDNLNDLLSHRPGPLDLVSKNILLLDDDSIPLSDDIGEHITDNEESLFSDSSNNFNIIFSGSFEATSFDSSFENVSPINQAEEHSKHTSSSSYDFVNYGDVHQQSYTPLSSPEDIFGQQSPEMAATTNMQGDGALSTSSTAATIEQQHITSAYKIPPAPDITPLLLAVAKQQQQQNFKNNFLGTSDSTSLPLGSLPNGLPVVTPASVASTASAYRQQKAQKKIRTKSVSKPKQIKFHEYKGPPSIMKASHQAALKNKKTQPHYEMLKLQQEQLMKWQVTPKSNCVTLLGMSRIAPKPENLLEFVNSSKFNHSNIASRQVKMLDMINSASSDVQKCPAVEKPQQIIHITSSIPAVVCTNMVATVSSETGKPPNPFDKPQLCLEDMKVSELRAECRKLNISCSGSKPQLLERLQLHKNSSSSLSFLADSRTGSSNRNDNSIGNLGNGDKILARAASVLPMDVDMTNGNVFPASNLRPIFILGSTPASSQSSFTSATSINTTFSFNSQPSNPPMSEVKPTSQQFHQHSSCNVTTLDSIKVEDDKPCMSTEDKMKISEKKIAKLERDLKQAKNEIKLKNQLMQVMLLSVATSANPRPQSARESLPSQQIQVGTAMGPRQEDSQQQNLSEEMVGLLMVQNQPEKVGAKGRPMQAFQSLSQQVHPGHQPIDKLTSYLKQQDATHQHFHHPASIHPNNQILISQQIQPQLMQNHKNILSNGNIGSWDRSQHMMPLKIENPSAVLQRQSIPSNAIPQLGMGPVPNSTMRASSSFVNLSSNSFNSLNFSPCENLNHLVHQDKNINQRLNQNVGGNSFESMLRLWNMQNQYKIQQGQQQHSTNPTIEDVLDVISSKSEFPMSAACGDLCTISHHPDEVDLFSSISDMNDHVTHDVDGIDISFPFMMDSTDTDNRQGMGNASHITRDSKMQTPQPEFELMDFFTNDISGSNSFFTHLDQQMPNIHTPFLHDNTVSGASNNEHLTIAKNSCYDLLNDFDLASFPPTSNCLPFEKTFTVEAASKF